MENLFPVQRVNDINCVDSRLIAESLGIQHKNLLATIRSYQKRIEPKFGGVAFQATNLKTNGGIITPVLIPNLPLIIAALVGVHCGVAQQLVYEIPFSLKESSVGVFAKFPVTPKPAIPSIPKSSAIINKIFGFCCWLKVIIEKKRRGIILGSFISIGIVFYQSIVSIKTIDLRFN